MCCFIAGKCTAGNGKGKTEWDLADRRRKMNWREEISKLVEGLAANRKAAMDFGASKEEVDGYITNEAKKWFDKLDNMNQVEMMMEQVSQFKI